MTINKRTVAVAVLGVLTGWAGLATAATALTGVYVSDSGYNGYPGQSCGWQFTPTANIKITKLGYWAGLVSSLNNRVTVTIYDSAGAAKVSGAIPAGSVTAIKEGAYAFVDVTAQNVVLNAGETYTIASYWVVDMYSNLDVQYTTTFSVDSSLITLGQIDLKSAGLRMPLDDLGDSWNTFLSANFQFEPAQVTPPTAEAGPDVALRSSQQAVTVLQGTGVDPQPGPSALTYRWLDNGTVLQDWTAVDQSGAAPLNLATVPALSLGAHPLTLEVTDGAATGSDTMTLTVSNAPPEAEAGPDVEVYSSQQALTTLQGTGVDPEPGPAAMTYRWLENGTVLQDWTALGEDGAASLSLAAPVAKLSLGEHILTLEVTDGAGTGSDTMTLTVTNTPPEAQVSPTHQSVEVNLDAIVLSAEVADFDGDTLQYQWLMGGSVLEAGTIQAPSDGSSVPVNDLIITAGDRRFPVGTYQVLLEVSDGKNPPVTLTATVEVKDTAAPTLTPTASTTMLWPPNGQLVPVTIWAHALDNGGGAVTLSAEVTSDEPVCWFCGRRCFGHCWWRVPDWYLDSVDSATGVIHLRLRAERYPWDFDGRVYTITLTATDQSGNQTVAKVEVRVPHDRRKR